MDLKKARKLVFVSGDTEIWAEVAIDGKFIVFGEKLHEQGCGLILKNDTVGKKTVTLNKPGTPCVDVSFEVIYFELSTKLDYFRKAIIVQGEKDLLNIVRFALDGEIYLSIDSGEYVRLSDCKKTNKQLSSIIEINIKDII
jgi:hypothetical protein